MPPLVSIIIPCHNQGKFLAQAFESVATQTYESWECILVNDGCQDNTDEVARALMLTDSRIKYIAQKHCGVSAARNRGVDLSSGDYLLFLDADDCLEDGKIRTAIEEFSRNRYADAVVSDVRYFRDNDVSRQSYGLQPQAGEWAGPRWNENLSLTEKLLIYNFIPVCAPLIRKKAAKAIGPWNTKLRGCEDWEYWLRASMLGVKFTYHPRPQSNALIRLHEGSASSVNQWMLKQEVKMRRLLAPALKGRYATTNRERALNALQRSCPKFVILEKLRIHLACSN